MAVSRKTVTVLFADVADSTALGERVDPETLRGALGRWFEEARSVIERHGGTVEKYVGDSVMAVFGVPQLHEADALRAVRAADELGDVLAGLNEQLERERGLRFTVRVGINTGEVVTGDGSGTLVTGDAVNVAKRLEEAGDGGDVIVGDATYKLARTAAQFERLAPLALKGKSARIRAWCLVGVDRDGLPYERRFDTPLVGRRRELEQLRRAFRRSVKERTCHLFTLLGAAGIGKTRLASELFEELTDDALLLTGRCLAYGDGITFWPLHEVIRELGGEENVVRLLAGNEDAELICERLTGEPGGQELFWAVRRLCETLARGRPLVLCFEDVHWAEPTFLDLIEYLAGWTRDAPMLLLCIARPEFLDERPAWLSGQENVASLTLSPLSASESKKLLGALGIGGESGKRIAEAAEGNPLYTEQMAAMVAEAGAVETIPPTIQALLAARLDRLDTDERAVIEAAAVCGKEFWRDAVTAVSEEERRGRIGSVLLSLVRKELIRPHRSAARPDDAFRFGHVLIRDAAYAAVPRETRALLHERFAHWLETESDEAELEEIVGYHLEQAYRNREALGPIDEHARALAIRAGELLGRAGRRAFARDDAHAAVVLLDRAVALLSDQDPARLELLRELGLALWSVGEVARAEALLDGLATAAAAAGNERVEWFTILERSAFRSQREPLTAGEKPLRVAQEAIQIFERLEDDRGLARAWRQLAGEHARRCQFAASETAGERALDYARRAGDTREESRSVDQLGTALLYGPTPVDEAIQRCEALLPERGTNRVLTANVSCALAGLKAMDGRFADAREDAAAAEAIYSELGLRFAVAGLTHVIGPAELLAGDAAAAETALRRGYEILRAAGAAGAAGLSAAQLAEALYIQGRLDEAADFAEHAQASAPAHDITTHAVALGVSAKVAAHSGDQQAVARAQSAVELARETEAVNLIGEALANHALTLKALSQTGRADELAAEAIAAFRRKRNRAAIQSVERTFAAAPEHLGERRLGFPPSRE